ncbi:MAG TPA: GGDEF domain-containing protein [Pseudomonas sp.]|nr:GGDEF domain-containing protein [Pseudomonas sp.]
MPPNPVPGAGIDANAADQPIGGIASILDRLDALVYVADMQTYELLYLNEYGRAIWGQYQGKACWQLLQAEQQGPCRFCSNAQLVDPDGRPAGVHVWEFQNTANGRWYQCRDQAIPWTDGRLVRLEIATDITERKRMEQQLHLAVSRAETLARTDELTGLNNRRAFFELGERAFVHNRRPRPMAVVMFDIDHFKQVNDQYGHDVGDDVLRYLASVLRECSRPSDVLCRMGGEEFLVLLPDTDAAGARIAAERLLVRLRYTNSPTGAPVTASIGIACSTSHDSPDATFKAADEALYQAKRTGRDRVVLACN